MFYIKSLFGLVISLALTLLLFQNCGSGMGSNVSFSSIPVSALDELTPVCREIEPGQFDIKLSHHWSESENFPEYNQIMSTPSVGDLDQDGIPEVAFVTFPDGQDYYRAEGVLRVINGLTKKELFTIGDPELMPMVSTPLIIDIDGDGKAEIVYPGADRKTAIAINFDGSFRWKTELKTGINFTGLAALDLYGDGVAEIIAGSEILKEKKLANGTYEIQKSSFNDTSRLSRNAFAKIVNGRPVIISSLGAQVFNDGKFQTLFEVKDAVCGDGCFPAVADLDKSSPGEEFIYSGSGLFRVYDQNGQILIDKNLTEHIPEDSCTNRDTVGGGQATVGNFDSDKSTTEVAIATGKSLTIFNAQGDKIAGSQTRDCSSLSTGVTSFDFNGDGTPEILYADEFMFRIYKITDSNELQVVWEIENSNGTLQEYPVVADITGDSRPEVLVVSNDYAGIKNRPGATHGLRIFEAPSKKLSESWMPTRSVWNQHAYYVYNVSSNLLPLSKFDSIDKSLTSNFKRNIPEIELECKIERPEEL